MLGLFSSKSAHPLADAKEMRRVLEELARHEPAAALEETMAWLESLGSAADIKLDLLLDLILRLDEAALSHAQRLGRDYLTSQRLSRSQEYQLWNCNCSYWQHLVTAYENCHDRYLSGDKAARKSIEASLALLYARLLRAYATVLKWTQFRYGPFNRNLWHGAGRIYLAAVTAKLVGKPFPFYASAPVSTIEHEYLKALVLHSSSVSNLLPLEMEIAERLITHLLPHFIFSDVSRPDSVYWVDVDKPLPPTRLMKTPDITPTLRFLSPGQALDALTKIRTRIEDNGAVPADINLGGQYSTTIVLPVLDHLALNWMPKPPMRSHSRHHVKSRLAVINGLETIYARLAGEGGREDGAEAWIAEDVSLGGMGAQVPLGANDWVRIGVLVGVQPEDGESWLIGVIRRFSRNSEGQGSVGIQTIGKSPCTIVADSGGLKTDAILLDSQAFGQSSALADILLAAAAYEEGIPLEFFINGRRYRLHPHLLVERCLDYAIGRYRVEICE